MRGKKNKRLYRRALLALLQIVAVVFVACGKNTTTERALPSEEDVIQTIGTESMELEPMVTEQLQQERVALQTKYLALSYPEAYAGVLLHQEVISETVTMEIFSMQTNDSVMELFRIYFGDEATGIVAGYLTMEGVEIPVTYSICQYNDDEFADENTRALYFETMNCFNEIMIGLQEDDRFHTEKTEVPVDSAETKLSYWSFTLPETVEYEESEENGQYKAVFYGNVARERIQLYTIFLGEPGGETVLGTYDVNGEPKKMSLESYEIIPAESWTDEDQASAYAMMATINDVLQVIMSSEGFSEEIPE